MSTEDFELDPERRLWKPSRRTFFFGLGATLLAPMLPQIPQPILKAATGWGNTTLAIEDVFTIKGVFAVNPFTYHTSDLEAFIVTGITDGVISLDRAVKPPLGAFANVR
jgi:hypothetical protein